MNRLANNPARTLRLLVSVRNTCEALSAATGGADIIDLKEPRSGALGALPLATVREVVSALRGAGITLPISATIGDLPMSEVAAIVERVAAVGACGVDAVKVGLTRDPAAHAVLDALARSPHPVVPVFIADHGLDNTLLARACAAPAGTFPAIMVDTADKQRGSLFDVLPTPVLQHFIATVRASQRQAGLAGALRDTHLARLTALQPDVAGFRGAVCTGDRSSRLEAAKVRQLAGALSQPLNTPTCPLCGQPNGCAAVAAGSLAVDCWCRQVTFPPSLLAQVPEAQRMAACICRACAEKEPAAALKPA